jgi:4-aminobutyrate aminotransferase-like enzyme
VLSAGPYAQVTRIIPPLVTTAAEVDTAIGVLGESLAAAGA